jgi:outer membrane protein assembly factor BamB
MAIVLATTFVLRGSALAGDWPMWGGRPGRNMVSPEKNLPSKWDVATQENIKWMADLGTLTYSNPVVGDGKIFVGTNNGRERNPDIKGDKGVMMCFAEADGKFLWQAVHHKLTPPMKYDWPEIGICSVPCVVGDRVYYVSNRCALVCADTNGFHDGENDGPIKNEKQRGQHHADFVWRLDMRKQLGVVPLFASASAPMVVGNLLFVGTGNGPDADESKVPAPKAPSFIAVDRLTGKVVWQDNSPGENITAGQWSSPAWGMVNGAPQVVFPGGDGWLYAFEPATGKLIWKFNGKQPLTDSQPNADDDENTFVATPVFHDNKVFVAMGRDPENCSGPGCLWAIDATQNNDVSRTGRLWCRKGKDFECSASTVAIGDGLLYAVESEGYLNCLDAATGKRHWRVDLKATTWSSPLLADRKVYVANQDGDIYVFKHGKQSKLLATNTMHETVCSSTVAANGTLYIVGRKHLYATAVPTRLATDWPMFRGNPQLTGVAGSNLPANPKLRWKSELPDEVESSAAISNSTVYVGCYDGFLYALDLATGKTKWKYQATESIRSSPCVAGGYVYFGDTGGVFHAVEVAGGKVKWKFRTEGEIISSANHVDGKLLFGSYDGYLYCLSAGDGRLLWKRETEGRIHGTSGVVGERVLVAGCDEELHIFRLNDGVSMGTVDMGSFSGASAAIHGPRVYVGTFNNQVIAVDWKNNRIDWTYQHPEREFPFYASAAVTDKLVVIGGRDKLVHALEADTGKPRWTFATKDKIDASPVIVGERAFIGSIDGNLYGLDLTGGKEVWRFEAGSSFIASPAAGEGVLVVGTEDGVIYCFGD